jgi:hypothetical protein
LSVLNSALFVIGYRLLAKNNDFEFLQR